ncbi:rhodanese-like domain-containing protein [Aurantibacter crassamenti]|uniref:rhodanese-like domain-containing protein n=1 Tax=Aurantibacter crassamenti TaxID=1837375 RepID=UPI00193A6CA7|nr:rhodanese-like domain-containing protein [Aurantibacter crassamenti]MBM1106600.1 rhodanese-like domain-containing protein [Aurantibacter crassamenti]
MSLLNSLFGIKNEYSDKIEVLDRDKFADAIMFKNVQLVDVRTANEYNGGHIKNAKNIDFFNASNFQNSFNKYNKEKPMYLYCRSGARSRKAAKRLVDLGFSKVYDLKGGYMQWG